MTRAFLDRLSFSGLFHDLAEPGGVPYRVELFGRFDKADIG
jgi:hypothetical protein